MTRTGPIVHRLRNVAWAVWCMRWRPYAALVTRRCCSTPRWRRHYRYCLSQYMTRGERVAATVWNLRRRLPWWCRQCGVRAPVHKFGCTIGGARARQIIVTVNRRTDHV